ncbi:hypothetical protein VTO73DRAFT_5076 [Trametes versicolor]
MHSRSVQQDIRPSFPENRIPPALSLGPSGAAQTLKFILCSIRRLSASAPSPNVIATLPVRLSPPLHIASSAAAALPTPAPSSSLAAFCVAVAARAALLSSFVGLAPPALIVRAGITAPERAQLSVIDSPRHPPLSQFPLALAIDRDDAKGRERGRSRGIASALLRTLLWQSPARFLLRSPDATKLLQKADVSPFALLPATLVHLALTHLMPLARTDLGPSAAHLAAASVEGVAAVVRSLPAVLSPSGPDISRMRRNTVSRRSRASLLDMRSVLTCSSMHHDMSSARSKFYAASPSSARVPESASPTFIRPFYSSAYPPPLHRGSPSVHLPTSTAARTGMIAVLEPTPGAGGFHLPLAPVNFSGQPARTPPSACGGAGDLQHPRMP